MSFELYKKMLSAYKNKDIRLFESFAINWVESVQENPFTNEDAHALFFSAQRYCRIWRKGGIDSRSAKRNMIKCIQKIAEIDLPYPLDLIEKEKEEEKDQEYKKKLEQEITEKVEEKTEDDVEQIELEEDICEKDEDIRYVLLAMSNAYNEGNEINFKQFTIHLMETALENPFAIETPEFLKFEEMKEAYIKHNMRKVHVKAAELCEIINNTEIYPEKIEIKKQKKETDDPEEEKKSWFKFLNPWR